MKKLLTILFIVPLIFGSCEKEDDSPNSNNGNPLTPSLGLIGYGSSGSSVYKTTNGGVSWSYLTTDNFTSISFPSNDIGYGSSGSSVYKTTNGGVSWSYLTTDNFTSISFP